MHMQLLHNDKVIIFDRTDFGRSNISLPNHRCRHDEHDKKLTVDCTAHSILYDVATNSLRPLMVQTDTWCSSGAVLPDGTLVQTGGYNDGDRAVRTFNPCNNGKCDWIEHPDYLSLSRWYSSNHILPDGRIIIVGGRRQHNYEFYPKDQYGQGAIRLRFLSETTDRKTENNLYPFLHLLPDGNLFIFANTQAILLDYRSNRVVRTYPRIPGDDPRNYPSTGSSVLLPLDENQGRNNNIQAEVLVCGGAPRGSFQQIKHGVFMRAVSTCGRLRVTDQDPQWIMESMPFPRVMCDMLLLPTGEVIIINGAQVGAAGFDNGRVAATRPVIYSPHAQSSRRFLVMSRAGRARMYHSSAILLPDGRVLVGGSNPHDNYSFTGVLYPTDLSLEAYSPPYLSWQNARVTPTILNVEHNIRYGSPFLLNFNVELFAGDRAVSVRIIAPSFTTHSFAMNQRMVVLRMTGGITHDVNQMYTLSAIGPSTAEIAPPGYYMLFVVHKGIPSPGVWVNIQ
ncbi:hypothetical protein Tsubulata_003738 [Turnera subulata]|uniref:Galactose oxidase-like Early set domain-containing protein n=1 Tax=Turnera subulata TaxID=218843 RepID=A0A9Q0G0T1_9ROSI|nr:hypothetical protein Tsubulata_003738 [Turnera subulata]